MGLNARIYTTAYARPPARRSFFPVISPSQIEPLKQHTNCRRRKSERLSVYSYCQRNGSEVRAKCKRSKPSQLDGGFVYCPIWLPRACFDCIKLLGVNTSVAPKEADDVVVELARQYEALVLSEDSDNFCCDIPKGANTLKRVVSSHVYVNLVD